MERAETTCSDLEYPWSMSVSRTQASIHEICVGKFFKATSSLIHVTHPASMLIMIPLLISTYVYTRYTLHLIVLIAWYRTIASFSSWLLRIPPPCWLSVWKPYYGHIRMCIAEHTGGDISSVQHGSRLTLPLETEFTPSSYSVILGACVAHLFISGSDSMQIFPHLCWMGFLYMVVFSRIGFGLEFIQSTGLGLVIGFGMEYTFPVYEGIYQSILESVLSKPQSWFEQTMVFAEQLMFALALSLVIRTCTRDIPSVLSRRFSQRAAACMTYSYDFVESHAGEARNVISDDVESNDGADEHSKSFHVSPGWMVGQRLLWSTLYIEVTWLLACLLHMGWWRDVLFLHESSSGSANQSDANVNVPYKKPNSRTVPLHLFIGLVCWIPTYAILSCLETSTPRFRPWIHHMIQHTLLWCIMVILFYVATLSISS